MINTFLPPMRTELVVCADPRCGASERIGIHSHQEQRHTSAIAAARPSPTKGTPLYGLKYPLWQVVIVLTFLAFGCPVPAIVAAFGVDERTVATWQSKAGQHAKALHEHVVGQGQVKRYRARCKLMSCTLTRNPARLGGDHHECLFRGCSCGAPSPRRHD